MILEKLLCATASSSRRYEAVGRTVRPLASESWLQMNDLDIPKLQSDLDELARTTWYVVEVGHDRRLKRGEVTITEEREPTGSGGLGEAGQAGLDFQYRQSG
jgi:hypothetical protein